MLFNKKILAGSILLALFATTAFAHGMSEAEKLAVIEGGNLRYLWLGATHMLSGYDHLLFVFGIVFFLTSFRDIAKYVTAFTLGHSVTLIYATFRGVQLNYFLIDAVIALSVCYIAFANIDGFKRYLGIRPPNMLAMIVGLGLVHGFGLSTRLQELPLSSDSLLLNIISFNVGVELGQIAALVVMLALIAAWRRRTSFGVFSRAANYLLIVAGGLLFLLQMHGYQHTENPEELLFASGSPEEQIVVATRQVVERSGDMAWQDMSVVRIPPGSSREFKLQMNRGGKMEFAWQSDGPALFYHLHADTTAGGKSVSFRKGTVEVDGGAVTATFDGTHGWYWKNNSKVPVDVRLMFRATYPPTGIEAAAK